MILEVLVEGKDANEARFSRLLQSVQDREAMHERATRKIHREFLPEPPHLLSEEDVGRSIFAPVIDKLKPVGQRVAYPMAALVTLWTAIACGQKIHEPLPTQTQKETAISTPVSEQPFLKSTTTENPSLKPKTSTPALTVTVQKVEQTPKINLLNEAYVAKVHAIIDQIRWADYGMNKSADEIKASFDETVAKNNANAALQNLLDLAEATIINPAWNENTHWPLKNEDESPGHKLLRENAIEPLMAAIRGEGDPESIAKMKMVYDEKPATWDPENQKRYYFWYEMLASIPSLSEEEVQIYSDYLSLSLTAGRDLYWPEDTSLINACKTRGIGPSDYIVDNILTSAYLLILNGETKVQIKGKEEVVKAPREYSDYEKGHARENLKRCGVEVPEN